MTDNSVWALTPVAICETQPLTAAGVHAVLGAHTGFDLVAEADNLDTLFLRSLTHPPSIAILDKAARLDRLSEWIEQSAGRTRTIVWGTGISEAEALRLLKLGVRGILRKTAPPDILLACLRSVAAGEIWMEESVLRSAPSLERYTRSELTPREQQVMQLVEHGLKNRDIARELGIRPGTVKIHLKHIFEKTGVRGRYGLALSGLRHRGQLSIARAHEAAG
jgi:two-component system nitrate/nitrite response regulator NarL